MIKLQNKKTGEIGICDLRIVHSSDTPLFYQSLSEVNEDWEDWEDYTPKAPLIKDERIRKAVKAWAEVNELEPDFEVRYSEYTFAFSLISWKADIDFNTQIEGLEHNKRYTIEELLGE